MSACQDVPTRQHRFEKGVCVFCEGCEVQPERPAYVVEAEAVGWGRIVYGQVRESWRKENGYPNEFDWLGEEPDSPAPGRLMKLPIQWKGPQ